jgi:hypothetical protein
VSKYEDNYEKILWNARQGRIKSASRKSRQPKLHIVSDIEPFKSPIDGSLISSRSTLREHENKHNVRQIGNDWAGSERPKNWEHITNGGE